MIPTNNNSKNFMFGMIALLSGNEMLIRAAQPIFDDMPDWMLDTMLEYIGTGYPSDDVSPELLDVDYWSEG